MLFVFALAGLFEHGKTSVLRIGDRKGFQFDRRTKVGDEFLDLSLAEWAVRKRRGRKRAAKGEFSPTDFAFSFF